MTQIDAIQNHHESRVINLDTIAHDVRRELECALGQKRIPKYEAIAVPCKDLKPVTSAIAEDEEGTRDGLFCMKARTCPDSPQNSILISVGLLQKQIFRLPVGTSIALSERL